jgi:hypothetical protein
MLISKILKTIYKYIAAIIFPLSITSCKQKTISEVHDTIWVETDNKSFKYSSIENADGSDRMDENTTFTRNERPNEFGYGKTSIRQGSKYTEQIMDIHRKPLLPANIEFLVNAIQGHMALVQMGRAFIFIDLKEHIDEAYLQHQIHYDFAYPYACDLALVDLKEESFFIDTKGNRVFDTNFEFAESFYEGSALVKNANKYFIINTKGEKIADVNYDQVITFSPHVWQVINIRKKNIKVDLLTEPVNKSVKWFTMKCITVKNGIEAG